MKKETSKQTVLEWILVALCVLLCAGMKLVFHACEVGENIMACHWAEQAAFGVAIVLVVQAILLVFIRKADGKLGIKLAMIPTALLEVCIPGVFIHLCMMNTMRCHTIMRPAVSLFGVAIAVVALVSALLERRQEQ
ncbi:MAG: DUF4418 family protein [Lachnospiraceae bacterium]|nr:DUF4418 family protein [Lachnospiraceae bacterium]